MAIMRGIFVKSFLVLGSAGLMGAPFAADAAKPAPAAVAMSVTQEASEEARIADMLELYAPLSKYLSEVAGIEIKMGYSRNMTEELQRTRTGSVGILVGPAHMIGSALRHGFEPVGTFSGSEKMAFVALGEFNSKGLQLKSYFAQVKNHSSHDVTLFSLTMDGIDVAVVDYSLAQK